MLDLPQGRGTFFFEPTLDGEWGTGVFNADGTTRVTTNLYDQMAEEYGLRQPWRRLCITPATGKSAVLAIA